MSDMLPTGSTIGILGGGPSSAEVAGNIWQLTRDAGGNMPQIKTGLCDWPANLSSQAVSHWLPMPCNRASACCKR